MSSSVGIPSILSLSPGPYSSHLLDVKEGSQELYDYIVSKLYTGVMDTTKTTAFSDLGYFWEEFILKQLNIAEEITIRIPYKEWMLPFKRDEKSMKDFSPLFIAYLIGTNSAFSVENYQNARKFLMKYGFAESMHGPIDPLPDVYMYNAYAFPSTRKFPLSREIKDKLRSMSQSYVLFSKQNARRLQKIVRDVAKSIGTNTGDVRAAYQDLIKSPFGVYFAPNFIEIWTAYGFKNIDFIYNILYALCLRNYSIDEVFVGMYSKLIRIYSCYDFIRMVYYVKNTYGGFYTSEMSNCLALTDFDTDSYDTIETFVFPKVALVRTYREEDAYAANPLLQEIRTDFLEKRWTDVKQKIWNLAKDDKRNLSIFKNFFLSSEYIEKVRLAHTGVSGSGITMAIDAICNAAPVNAYYLYVSSLYALYDESFMESIFQTYMNCITLCLINSSQLNADTDIVPILDFLSSLSRKTLFATVPSYFSPKYLYPKKLATVLNNVKMLLELYKRQDTINPAVLQDYINDYPFLFTEPIVREVYPTMHLKFPPAPSTSLSTYWSNVSRSFFC